MLSKSLERVFVKILKRLSDGFLVFKMGLFSTCFQNNNNKLFIALNGDPKYIFGLNLVKIGSMPKNHFVWVKGTPKWIFQTKLKIEFLCDYCTLSILWFS